MLRQGHTARKVQNPTLRGHLSTLSKGTEMPFSQAGGVGIRRTLTQEPRREALGPPSLFVKAGSPAVQAGFELAVLQRTTLNLWSSCPHLSSAGVTGMQDQPCFHAVQLKLRALTMLGKHSAN